MPKTYVLSEIIFTDSGTPISRVLRTASSTDGLKDLADEANDLYETAVIEGVRAKHAAAQEASPDCVVEAKPQPGGPAETMRRFRRGPEQVADANN